MFPLRRQDQKQAKNPKFKKNRKFNIYCFYDILIEELKFKYTCITISYRHGLLTDIIQLNIVIAFVQKMNSEKRMLVRVHFDAQRVTVKFLS